MVLGSQKIMLRTNCGHATCLPSCWSNHSRLKNGDEIQSFPFWVTELEIRNGYLGKRWNIVRNICHKLCAVLVLAASQWKLNKNKTFNTIKSMFNVGSQPLCSPNIMPTFSALTALVLQSDANLLICPIHLSLPQRKHIIYYSILITYFIS